MTGVTAERSEVPAARADTLKNPARDLGRKRPAPQLQRSGLRPSAVPVPRRSAGAETPNRASTHANRPRLTIGPIDDPFEREADRVADQVVRHPARSLSATPGSIRVSRECAGCVDDKRQHLQTKRPHAQATGQIAPSIVHDVLAAPGQAIDSASRKFFEPRFGASFGDVRVHNDALANRSAEAVGALAYTVGRNVVFAGGRYAPDTAAGRRLLAHELVHVRQQSAGDPSVLRRSVITCAEALAQPPDLSLIAGGGTVIHQLIREDFMKKTGGTDVTIPGASAAPLRTGGLCGKPASVIPPQIIGGRAGAGIPDLALRTPAGVLLVAEVKPAVVPCLIDGENQLLGYIDAGNARDDPQVAWRAAMGITVVSPMLERHYEPPSFALANAEIETTWCTPGLLAYTIHRPGERIRVPVPAPEPSTEEQRRTIRQRLPAVPEWVWVAVGAVVVGLIIACFASGVCEVGAILGAIAAAVGEAAAFIGPIIVAAMRAAGALPA